MAAGIGRILVILIVAKKPHTLKQETQVEKQPLNVEDPEKNLVYQMATPTSGPIKVSADKKALENI